MKNIHTKQKETDRKEGMESNIEVWEDLVDIKELF